MNEVNEVKDLEMKNAKEKILKGSAFSALRLAEQKMHEYACSLDIGDDRIKAFEIYENIRNAARVG
jgi:uncharacterized Zn ribbon protein